MKAIEVSPAVPEALSLFLEAREPQGDFLATAVAALAREKAAHFSVINKFLDADVVQAGHLLEELNEFQIRLEMERYLSGEVEDVYHDLRERAQNQQVELHRAKVRLTDLKIALCRFIVAAENPKQDLSGHRSFEEWMDAATMAEMRMARALEVTPEPARQQFLTQYTTMRSIVCSYDGPSQFLRQLESTWGSVEALHEKVRLEMDVVQSEETLAATRKELSTVMLDLSSLQNRLQSQQARQAGELVVKKKPLWLRLAPFLLAALLGVGGYLFLRSDAGKTDRESGGVITQKSCREIDEQIRNSPRYQSQVLIFRKFGHDVYFKASALTCEKLHRLDSVQVSALAALLKLDYATGHRETAAFNGKRVLQVKEIGVGKLVVLLLNPTAADLQLKLRVLELCTFLKAVLQPDPAGDALIVDLPPSAPEL